MIRSCTAEKIIEHISNPDLLFPNEVSEFNKIEYAFHPFIINKDDNIEYEKRGINITQDHRFNWNSGYCIMNAIPEHQNIRWLLWRIAVGRLITYYRNSLETCSSKKIKDYDVPMISSQPCYRKTKKSFGFTRLLFLDIDNEDLNKNYTSIDNFIENNDNFLFVYTSYSHTKKKHKFRVGYFLDNYITSEDIMKKCINYLGRDLNFDKQCNTSDRGFFGNTNAIFYLPKQIQYLNLNELVYKSEKYNESLISISKSTNRKKVEYIINKDNSKLATANKRNLKIVLENCSIIQNIANRNLVNHNEWVLIVNNFCKIKKTKELFLDKIRSRWGSTEKFEKTWIDQSLNYKGLTRCENCSFFNECGLQRFNNKLNLFHLVTTKEKIINPRYYLVEKKKTIQMNNADYSYQKMQEQFEKIVNEEENGKLYILKGETGIGKTTMLKNFGYNGLYCFKTHRLSKEFELGCEYPIITEDFPNYDEIKYCYNNGIPAQKIIDTVIDDNLDHPAIKKYKSKMNNFIHSDISKITHSRLLMSKKIFNTIQHDTIIIDEDIISNGISTGYLQIESFSRIIKYFPNNIAKLIQKDLNLTGFPICPKPTPFKRKTKIIVSKYLRDNYKLLKNYDLVNFLTFLNSDYYILDTRTASLNFITNLIDQLKELLNKGKKIIILSATPLIELYYKIFAADKVKIYNSYKIKSKGTVNLYKPVRKRVSKSSIEKMSDEYLKFLLSQLDNNGKIKKVISYSSMKYRLEKLGYELVEYFFNSVGTNKYSGEDLIILGTPRYPEPSYIMIAKALGLDCDEFPQIHPNAGYAKSGNFVVRQRCYQDETLSSLQIMFTQNELIQAIGRARTIRNDCIVNVCTDIPLPDILIQKI